MKISANGITQEVDLSLSLSKNTFLFPRQEMRLTIRTPLRPELLEAITSDDHKMILAQDGADTIISDQVTPFRESFGRDGYTLEFF